MSPEVTAAIIAASVSFLTLIGTLAAQYFGRRATSRDTQEALKEQGKQLDRTLAEQRTRTLNERFATAAEQLGSDKPAVRLAGVMHHRAADGDGEVLHHLTRPRLEYCPLLTGQVRRVPRHAVMTQAARRCAASAPGRGRVNRHQDPWRTRWLDTSPLPGVSRARATRRTVTRSMRLRPACPACLGNT